MIKKQDTERILCSIEKTLLDAFVDTSSHAVIKRIIHKTVQEACATGFADGYRLHKQLSFLESRRNMNAAPSEYEEALAESLGLLKLHLPKIDAIYKENSWQVESDSGSTYEHLANLQRKINSQ